MDRSQGVDQAVRVEVYRLFVELGRAPVPAEIAHALDLRHDAVEDALRRLAAEHALVLAPGTPYIWMANPFSAIPTPFSVEADGRTFFGNCIWDAMGVVAMLGGTGTVRTWCPGCLERMEVAVSDGHLTSADGIVHYSVPAAHWWDDIGFN